MSNTDQKNMGEVNIGWQEFRFHKIEGLDYVHIPFRLTRQEWEQLCDPWVTIPQAALVCHSLFTLRAWVDWCGEWDYCDVYEIAPRYWPDHPRQFGPHKTEGLAKRKALDFLVKRRCIVLIEEQNTCTTVVQ